MELRIREICETRVRYGYRRIHVLLRREGWQVNIKKTRRIYNELGLQLRNKHPKRRVKAKLCDDRQEAVGPNDVWAMDFVHDQLALGNKLRILTIVDIHSRFCRECLKLCVSERAHAVFKYGQASKRPANIMAS